MVDDDPDLLFAMSELLREAGADVCVSAQSLAELQAQRARALECSLAVVDVNLGPRQPTGVDVYRWLRAEGFPGRIVFLTGHAQSNELVQAACRTPDTSVLSKPIDADVLLRLAGVPA